MNDARPHLPAESVDVAAVGGLDDGRSRQRARQFFIAGGIFAVLAWTATAFAGYHSESDGVYASWFAIFPTAFSPIGLFALSEKTSPGKAVGVALAAGLCASISLAFFFAAIWPSL